MAGSSQKLMVAAAGAAAVVAAAALGGGCASQGDAGSSGEDAWTGPLPADVAAVLSRPSPRTLKPLLESNDPEVRRDAVRAVGRLGGDEAAAAANEAIRSSSDADEVDACFAVGITGSPRAASLLEPHLHLYALGSSGGVPIHFPGAPLPRVRAGCASLAACTDDAAGELLVRVASTPFTDSPPEALEALFCHVRWRGRPLGPLPESLVPDALAAYERHDDPRCRAGIGWLGRMSKDPRLLDPLVRLTGDPEAEVRRAAALGLADGKDATARTPSDADSALAALLPLGDDKDQRVVASACRAVASYDRPEAIEWLRARLKHKDFNVRVAACEGLGTRKAAAASQELQHLALEDPSPSVRFAAATQLASFAPGDAQSLPGWMFHSPEAYVREGGVRALAAGDRPDVAEELARIASSDPHVRVRQAALECMKDRKDPLVEAALRSAVEGDDPVIASVAADTAAKNGLAALLPAIRALLTRFPGTPGADAREGAVVALSKLGDDSDWDRIRAVAADDPDGGVRLAAHKVLAERAKAPMPPDGADRRGVPADRLPGGAPLLRKDVLLVLETSEGTMKIRLDAEQAPIHSSHVAHLARKGFYDGLTWHRVVPDFVIQGGCPRGDGSGNAGVTLPLEPTRIPFERGTLGMPRSNHPDTGGCQLFICHSRAPHLDVKYTAFGRVVEGLDVIDRIDVGAKIVRARVEEIR